MATFGLLQRTIVTMRGYGLCITIIQESVVTVAVRDTVFLFGA